MNRSILSALAAAAVLAAGCDTGPAAGSGDTIVASEPANSTPQPAPSPSPGPGQTPDSSPPAPEGSALGTRDNPAPFGATARIGDWEVTLLAADLDGEERVLSANMFNDAAPDGSRYVLVEIEATYVGTESGDPFWDLSWKLVGNRANTFDERCGVIPDPLRDGGETFPGGVVTGNVCVTAPEDQLLGATVLVEGLFGDNRTFFALP